MTNEINITGDIYTVHLDEGLLRHAVAGRDKTLSLKAMEYIPAIDHFRFLYDRRDKNIFQLTADTWRIPEEVVLVEIAGPAILDPIAYAKQQGSTIQPSIALLAEAAGCRYSVILPKVELGGHLFFLDTRTIEFIDSLNPSNRLQFEWFKPDKGKHLSMLYNTRTRTKAGLTKGDDSKDFIKIRFPSTGQMLKYLDEAMQYQPPSDASQLQLKSLRTPRVTPPQALIKARLN